MTKKQYKAFAFEVKQIQEDDSDNFIIEGFASTFGNLDLDEEIIMPGAFTESLQKTPQVPLLVLHNMRQMLPVGKTIHLEEQAKGLFFRAILPKSDTFVKDRLMPQIKIGSLREVSIGFLIKEFEFDTETRITRITKIDLFEISVVPKAANSQATITDFKSFKDVEKDMKSLSDVEGYLKEGGLSNNESKALISKIKEFSKSQREVDDSDNTKGQCDVALLISKLKSHNQLLTIKNNLELCQNQNK
jgi:hypothetical protein